VTKIKDMINFTFNSTHEVFFFNSTFGDYNIQSDMSDFQKVYAAYLETRKDYSKKLLDKVRYMEFVPWKISFNHMVQKRYGFLKHCNETAYAGFLDTIDANLNIANEMGKKENIVFMSGSDNFRPTGKFFSFDPHLEGIMAHRLQRLRYWRVFHMGKMDCYKTQNCQKVCCGKQPKTSYPEFRHALIVVNSYGSLL